MRSPRQHLAGFRTIAQWYKRTGLLLMFTLMLASCSGSSSQDDPPIDDGTGMPTPPGDVLAAVYSSTDAELSWEPSQDDGWIMGYEISRDGALIAPLQDALSYFDPELEPDTSYRYSIVAVDDEGNRSLPAEIELRTEDGPPLPTINRANHASLLAEVFDIYSGALFEAPLLGLEPLAMDDSNGTATLEDHYWLKSYDCENDGQADSRRRDGEPGDSNLSMHFEQCTLNGVLYDGDVEGSGLVFNTNGLQIVTANDDALQLEGSASRSFGSLEPYGVTPSWRLVDASVSITTADGTIKASRANTYFGAGYQHAETTRYLASLSGGLTLQSPLTGEQAIMVTTPEPLVATDFEVPFAAYRSAHDWYFDTGTLQLSAEDGSTLTLTPTTDAPENVTITVAQGSYSASFQKPWSTWVPHLQLPPIIEDAPFATDLPATTSVIRMDNHEALITAALDVMKGTRYWSLMESVPVRWTGDDYQDVDLQDSWLYTGMGCDNGGSATTQFTIVGGFIEHAAASFDQCLFNSDSIEPPYDVVDIRGVEYHGAVQGWTSVGGHSVTSQDLTLTRSPDVDLHLAGWLQQSHSFTRNDGYQLRRTDELSVTASEPDGTVLEVTNATVYWGGGWLGGGYRADLAGNAIFRSSQTNDRRIKISTPEAFRYDALDGNTAWTFPSGRLQLLADDGSELILDAGAAEPGRVQITVNNNEGTANFEVDWTLWADSLRP